MTLETPGMAPGFKDSDLIVATRGGDRDAGETLARAARMACYRLALQLLGNGEDARDVAQEAILKFFGSIARFNVGKPIRPFLFQIVRNMCTDRFRRGKVRPCDALDAHPEPAGRDDSPETALQRRRLQEKVWQALQHLKPIHKEILVLRDYQDLSYTQIAQILGIPNGTVMSRLHAARKALRGQLGGSL